jgi:hypothetical protein
MKRFFLLVIPIVFIGCVSTPDSVLRAGAYSLDASVVVEHNTIATIEELGNELNTVIEEAYTVQFQNLRASIVKPDGTVNADQYDALLAAISNTVQEKKEGYDQVVQERIDSIRFQFATQRHLNDLVQRYNSATGISDATFNELVSGASGVASGLLEMEGKRRVARANDPDRVDWDKLINMSKRKAYDHLWEKADTFDVEVWKEESGTRVRGILDLLQDRVGTSDASEEQRANLLELLGKIRGTVGAVE